jgi:hypothetical protein
VHEGARFVAGVGVGHQPNQPAMRCVWPSRRNCTISSACSDWIGLSSREQRNAHLAGNVRLEFVKGREGQIAKATLTAISNNRRGSGDERVEESTAIQWTLWGKQVENAAEYLGKGSHVNIVGRLRNNTTTTRMPRARTCTGSASRPTRSRAP